MTLSRQLITLILCTFLLIFAGTFWISVENTRSYLMQQLDSQTKNAADSLGISLAPHMEKQDVAAMETMVNALFDSGYYRALTLTLMSGEVLIARHNTMQVEGVPGWFIQQLVIDAPKVETVITSGWRQSGRLQLTAHSGVAYQRLWQTTYEIFWWSMLAFIFALVGTITILRTILKPLHAVEEQAEAICNREFPIMERVPSTRELRRVVAAMNRLSIKVKSNIENLSLRAEQMRREAHFDALTGLMNRSGFLNSLQHHIQDREHAGSGALLLIRLSHFSDYNRAEGFQGGDELLTTVAGVISSIAQSHLHAVTARTKGAEFGIILPLADVEVGEGFARACIHELQAQFSSLDSIAHIGIVMFDDDESVNSLLAQADTALASALHQGPNSYFISSQSSDAGSAAAWRALINAAMHNNTIQLLAQHVMGADEKLLYREVLMRICDETGEAIPPGSFAAMADRLELNRELDQYLIERITEIIEADSEAPALAINLSNRSLHHRAFITWLESHLQAHRKICASLLFEISEHALLQDLDMASDLIVMIHRHGGRVVMEHFGTKLSAFKTLRALKLDYIKLDGTHIRNIAEQRENQFFLQTIIDIAHGLEIGVIAEHVESQEDREILQGLGIDAMQGYLFAAPVALA